MVPELFFSLSWSEFCHKQCMFLFLLARAVLARNIGPPLSLCGPYCARSTLPRHRAFIPQNGPSARLVLKRLLVFYLNISTQLGLLAHLLRSLRQLVALSTACLDVRAFVKQSERDVYYVHSSLQHPSCCNVHL